MFRTTHSTRVGCSLLLWVLPWLIGLYGCSTENRLSRQFHQVVASQAAGDQPDYSRILSHWTQSGTIYNRLDTELLVTATYHAPEFVRAYVTAYASAYHLEPEQEQSLRTERERNLHEFHEFLLAVYVPKTEWSDFADSNSPWKLFLTTERRQQLSPLEIYRVREASRLVTSFYPYIKPWQTVYRVRFATRYPDSAEPFPQPGDRTLLLVVTGPRGTVELAWQLQHIDVRATPSSE